MSTTARRPADEPFTRTFYGRLLFGELVVVGALLVTVAVVMLSVAPSLFDLYLYTNGPFPAVDLSPIAGAFASALWISLATALLVAAVAAVVLAVVIVRPLRMQLRQFTLVARQVASGDFSRRVDLGRDAGAEVAVLAQSLNAMASQLGEAEAARRRLLADLAHELRTPIASLAVTVEALSDGVLPADSAAFATLEEQTGRLTRLATDLRHISDAQGSLSVVKEPCELSELLENASAAAAEAYQRKGVDLLVAEAPACSMLVDPQRVGQVLANLLSNSLRHTRPGGQVALAAAIDPEWVVITVLDDGDGIHADHLPHVFDRFYRTDTARSRDTGGTGIGLSVSAAIASAHGGSLTAASDGEGHGSRFTLRLPLPDCVEESSSPAGVGGQG